MGLALFLGTLALFSPTLFNGFVDYDDPAYVTENRPIQEGLDWPVVRWAFSTGYFANWHPLTWLSHALDYQLFGLHPAGHHAVNVVWHALNAVLVFLVFRRLTDRFWAAAFCAALFAWHPLRVESVAWISERKDVLSGFFGLATLWFYLRSIDAPVTVAAKANSPAERPPRRFFYLNRSRSYALALTSFTLGLLSKPVLVTLPALMLLLDVTLLHRAADFRAARRCVVEKIPFLLLALGSCVITYIVQQKAGSVSSMAGAPWDFRLGNALVSLPRYLGKFAWPTGLAVHYPHPGYWPGASLVAAGALILAITAAAVWQYRRRPGLLAGWLWYLGMLVPMLGIVQVGTQAMADRYTYWPLLGIELALISLWPATQYTRVVVAFLTAATLACAAVTWHQISYWRDSFALFNHTLAVTKNNGEVHRFLGTAFSHAGRQGEAREQFERALQIKPDDFTAHNNLGATLPHLGQSWGDAIREFQIALQIKPEYLLAWNNLGNAYLRLDRFEEAAKCFEEAVRLAPNSAEAMNNRSVALAALGRSNEALVNARAAVALDPKFVAARQHYAKLLSTQGKIDNAIAQYEAAIAIDPSRADLHQSLAKLLAQEPGRRSEARGHYEAALRLNPNLGLSQVGLAALLWSDQRPAEALLHYEKAESVGYASADLFRAMGRLLLDTGRRDEAEKRWMQALALQSDLGDVQSELGRLQVESGRFTEGLSHLQEAVRLTPDSVAAQSYLGIALARAGRPSEALAPLQQAVKLAPDDPEARNNLANCLLALDQVDLAIAEYREAIRLRPDFSVARSNLDEALHRSDRSAEADSP